MSTPNNQDPYGPNPYADPAQEHVPGQAQYAPPGQERYANGEQAYAPAEGASPAEGGAPAEGASRSPGAAPGQGAVPGQGTSWEENQQQGAYEGYPQGSETPGGQTPGSQAPGGTGTQAGPGTGGGYGSGGGYGGGMGGGRPTSYLAGAPVGFVEAIRGAVSNIFTWRGRASRSAFWWFMLAYVVIGAILSLIENRSTAAGVILNIIVGIPLFIAMIGVAVRRLHDANHTGWWWWIWFIPVVGWIVLLVFYLQPSTPGPNKYNKAR